MTHPPPADLRRFLARLTMFCLPVFGLLVAEQVALIRGWLTFRAWEQLVVLPAATHPDPPFPGPFYPRQTVRRTEQGDLGFRTPLAAYRKVTWQTDRYGYRNQDSADPPTVVVIGDSMIAGASLDQSEMLSSVLARELGVPVINLAPADVATLLGQSRFFDHRPKLVIQGMTERVLERSRSCEPPPPRPLDYVADSALDRLATAWWVARDRQLKQPFFHWAQNRLLGLRITSSLGRDRRTLFHRGDGVHKVDLAMIDQGVRNLARCHALLAANGIAYLPFVVPDKETVYWDLLPSGRKPAGYQRALAGLARAGLPTVDLEARFAAERQQSPEPLYPPDESHWSPRAVAMTGRLLVEAIQGLGYLGTPPR
jgi:hypothetical protein